MSEINNELNSVDNTLNVRKTSVEAKYDSSIYSENLKSVVSKVLFATAFSLSPSVCAIAQEALRVQSPQRYNLDGTQAVNEKDRTDSDAGSKRMSIGLIRSEGGGSQMTQNAELKDKEVADLVIRRIELNSRFNDILMSITNKDISDIDTKDKVLFSRYTEFRDLYLRTNAINVSSIKRIEEYLRAKGFKF